MVPGRPTRTKHLLTFQTCSTARLAHIDWRRHRIWRSIWSRLWYDFMRVASHKKTLTMMRTVCTTKSVMNVTPSWMSTLVMMWVQRSESWVGWNYGCRRQCCWIQLRWCARRHTEHHFIWSWIDRNTGAIHADDTGDQETTTHVSDTRSDATLLDVIRAWSRGLLVKTSVPPWPCETYMGRDK